MNLYRIGDTVLNLDRINGIYDHHITADAGATAGRDVLRVVFDNAQIDLTGREAQVFRRWFRHTSKNLSPFRDEDGTELVSPEDQVRKSLDALIALIDHQARPRDPGVRHAAHRLAALIDRFITGELQPARADDFERSLGMAHDEAHTVSHP
jgi:hypothetical protein